MELLKMNIKKTQGLQPADAGKYKRLKKKIAKLKAEGKSGVQAQPEKRQTVEQQPKSGENNPGEKRNQ